MTITIKCPRCGSDELYSSEQAIIDYPINVTREDDGKLAWAYTGEDPRTYDEASVFRDQIRCDRCDWEGALGALESGAAALDSIQALLSGKEWDSGTIEDVAEIIRRTGRVIEEPAP